MSGNEYIDGWCINLCGLQAAIMVKGDVSMPIGNSLFRRCGRVVITVIMW
jgi:hypothetical protein